MILHQNMQFSHLFVRMYRRVRFFRWILFPYDIPQILAKNYVLSSYTQSWISIYVCSHSLLHNNSFHLYCIVPKKGLCIHRSICLIFPTTDFFLQKWGSRRIRSGSYQIQTIGFPVFLRIKTIPLGIDNNETSD